MFLITTLFQVYKNSFRIVMKQLSTIMLCTLATFSLVAPSFAWDFSVSGSSSAKYFRETVNDGTVDTKDDINNTFTSNAGGITASNTHTDGPNSTTFSYTAAWNSDAGNFDEYVTVSGSKKVGNWTASTSTSQHIQKDIGPGADDNAAVAKPMAAGNSAAITLTDGFITYKLGDTSHLSSAEKTVNGPMDGAVDAEARVDSFNGFSVGFAIGNGTLTFALDENNSTTGTAFGETGTLSMACGSNNLAYGLNFSGDVGVDLSFTYGSGSATPSIDTCTGDNKSNEATFNTMGLGVAIPIGDMSLALDYESSGLTNTQNGNNQTKRVNKSNSL